MTITDDRVMGKLGESQYTPQISRTPAQGSPRAPLDLNLARSEKPNREYEHALREIYE